MTSGSKGQSGNPDISRTPGGTIKAGGAAPTILGDFVLRREIGRGGMGTVYEAWQQSLQRTVALKILSPHISATSGAVVRFQREAQAAAKLNHAHIIPIYAQGDEDGIYYYAMELVNGPSLSQVIASAREDEGATQILDGEETVALWRSGTVADSNAETIAAPLAEDLPPPPAPASSSVTSSSAVASREEFDEIARQMAEVADALDYAHKQGIIHRDIKPHNLMMGPDGRLRISDFGLARIREEPGVTTTGELIGSPLYMSCEQVSQGGANVDHRTDIYSLGATMYEWIALVPPFPGETRESVIAAILHSDIRSPRELNKAIPLDLETILLKALERNPDRRYQDAGDMRDDLRRYLLNTPIHARRAGPFVRFGRLIARHQVASVAAAAVVVALTLSLALFRSSRVAENQVERATEAERKSARIEEEHKSILEAVRYLTPETQAVAATGEAVLPVMQGLWTANRESGPDAAAVTSAGGIVTRLADEMLYSYSHTPEDSLPPARPEPTANGGVDDSDLLATVQAETDRSRQYEFLENLLQSNRRAHEARRIMLSLLRADRRYDEMLSHAQFFVMYAPQQAEPYVWKAIARFLKKEPDEALRDCERAIELDGLSPWGHTMRGLLLAQKGQVDDAVASLDSALQLAPSLVPALLAESLAYSRADQLDAAIEILSDVLAIEPENADALAARGQYHMQAEQFGDAAADFQESMRIGGRSIAVNLQYLNAVTRRIETESGGGPAVPEVTTGGQAPGKGDESSGAWPSQWLNRLLDRPDRSTAESDTVDRSGSRSPGYPMPVRRGLGT